MGRRRYLTDCAELNGDCPSRVTRLMKSGFLELNLRWPVTSGWYEKRQCATNPAVILSLLFIRQDRSNKSRDEKKASQYVGW
jgi:hypothetical protein